MLLSGIMTTALALALPAIVTAGQNCKCQDDRGQYNQLTKECCAKACALSYFPGPNNQCSARGTNCIDSGAFVKCCQGKGVGGAHCWN
jgi:hypothetical protein